MKTMRYVVAVAGLVIAGAALGTSTQTATATPSEKVVICHATASHTNPYTVNDVNTSSVDEVNNQYLNGHGDHTGPVWYPGITEGWGDIIPPFESPIGTAFPGYNWTTAGQAIWNNGCEFPPVTPLAPTYTPSEVCEVLDTYTIPSVTGIEYRVGGVATSAGTFQLDEGVVVVITAHALEGYELAAGTWTWTFTGSDVQPCPVEPPPVTPPVVTPPETESLPPVVNPPVVTPPAVTPPAVTPTPAALPTTGATSWILVTLATSLLAAGIGLRVLGRET